MKFIFFLSMVLLSACRSSQPGELVGVDLTPPLEGPTWELKELNGVAVNAGPNERIISLRLDAAAKSMSGFGGCNQLVGNYTLDGKKITLRAGSTKMACPDQPDLETTFLKAIGSVTAYKIKDYKLILMQGKSPVAIFKQYIRPTG